MGGGGRRLKTPSETFKIFTSNGGIPKSLSQLETPFLAKTKKILIAKNLDFGGENGTGFSNGFSNGQISKPGYHIRALSL